MSANDNKGTTIGSGRIRMPKVFQFNAVTTAERTALSPAATDEGTVVFDGDLNKLVLWDGAAWKNVDGTALA